MFDPLEDVYLDPRWPHLQHVYELLSTLLDSDFLKQPFAKHCITRSFVRRVGTLPRLGGRLIDAPFVVRRMMRREFDLVVMLLVRTSNVFVLTYVRAHCVLHNVLTMDIAAHPGTGTISVI